MLNEFCLKHPRVVSVPVIMSCLNRCLPKPKLLINFIYLLNEIENVIFGLNKSFSHFWVLKLLLKCGNLYNLYIIETSELWNIGHIENGCRWFKNYLLWNCSEDYCINIVLWGGGGWMLKWKFVDFQAKRVQ